LVLHTLQLVIIYCADYDTLLAHAIQQLWSRGRWIPPRACALPRTPRRRSWMAFSTQVVRHPVASDLTAIGLTKKLLLVPGLVADWKQSSAWGGARTALTLAKAHYPELASRRVAKTERCWMKPPSGRACWDTISSMPWARSWMYTMKHTICQGLQAKLRRRSPQLLKVLMAVMTQLPPPRRPESYPALWQEKQCINSAPEWVCKLNF
jgi:hypothetical protein